MSHILTHYQCKHQRQVPGVSQAGVKAMFHYPFPGNIRELENPIEHSEILATDGAPIEPHHLFSSGERIEGEVLSLLIGPGSTGTLQRNLDRADGASHPLHTSIAPLHDTEVQLLRRRCTRPAATSLQQPGCWVSVARPVRIGFGSLEEQHAGKSPDSSFIDPFTLSVVCAVIFRCNGFTQCSSMSEILMRTPFQEVN
ncbi:hypothetical protein [Acidovorax sp. CF316]|uniref:hypothetical protein n=1 Tax=Acidovorax sp. CF316 TaxID=1144317 RepID=UPI00351084EC